MKRYKPRIFVFILIVLIIISTAYGVLSGLFLLNPLENKINEYSDYYKDLSKQCNDVRILSKLDSRVVGKNRELIDRYCCMKTVLLMAESNGIPLSFPSPLPEGDGLINCPAGYVVKPPSRDRIFCGSNIMSRFIWCEPIIK
jgi:hypothetical protein